MSINHGNGVVQWQPGIEDVGGHTVTVRADDQICGFDRQTYTLTVDVPLNQAPDGAILSPSGGTAVLAGESIHFEGSGTDPDNDLPLSHHWHFGAGSGVADSESQDPGELTFNRPGIFTVTLSVTDAEGLTDPSPATVQVTVNTPPVTDPEAQVAALELLKQESLEVPSVRFERGIPRFATMRVSLPDILPDDPVLKANAFLHRYRNLYRLYDPLKQLHLNRIVTDEFGRHMFFGQHRGNTPVLGAELAVHMEGNDVTLTNGNYLDEIPWFPPPVLDVKRAEEIALENAPGADAVLTGETRLMYFNMGLITGEPDETHYTWRVVLRGQDATTGIAESWLCFVDAHSGGVLLYLSQTASHTTDNRTFDIQTAGFTNSNFCWDSPPEISDVQWLDENGATANYPGGTASFPGGDDDGDNAFTFSHRVYDYYHSNFQRHSWNGDINNEDVVEAMVHVGPQFGTANWVFNAFYDSGCDHIQFLDRTVSLDILAHEFTHAVTSNSINSTATSLGLIYNGQSGALNESYSDIFAVMIDTGDWLFGEDVPANTEDGWGGDGAPETGLQCGNFVDDDFDNFVDEGCPGSCQDGLDNGNDGLIDTDEVGCISRDLSDPPRKIRRYGNREFPHPDHMTHFLTPAELRVELSLSDALGDNDGVCDPGEACRDLDNNGVHINNGIPNKAAYLIVNGGTHSGITVKGIGRQKGQQLFYNVLTTRLMDSSTFRDARDHTVKAAGDFRKANNAHGFTLQDICSVINGFAAVGLGPQDRNCDGTEDSDSEDSDGDFSSDSWDNCPDIANPGQEDTDEDGQGDVCDPDDDDDSIGDYLDNCPLKANTNQLDDDNDDIGEACEDDDGDGKFNDGDGSGTIGDNPCAYYNDKNCDDNCRQVPNYFQMNNDSDNLGDECDPDDDNDGILDDGDGSKAIGDNPCQDSNPNNCDDNCRFAVNGNQEDTDGDTVGDACDNCGDLQNADQLDTDDDGFGNVCDTDDDDDGIPDDEDRCPYHYDSQLSVLLGLPCYWTEGELFEKLTAVDVNLNLRRGLEPHDIVRIPIFPCLGAESPIPCPGWLPESYHSEVKIALPFDMRARIVDDKGFVAAKAGPGSTTALRFKPRGDYYYTPPAETDIDYFEKLSFARNSASGTSGREVYRGSSYFLEIFLSDEMAPAQDYPASIGIDADSDGDGMVDTYEIEHGLDPHSKDGHGDKDGDGFINIAEYRAGSGVGDPESWPVDIHITLHKGFNLFGLPVTESTELTSFDLLPLLGRSTEIDRVLAYDAISESLKETFYDGSGPAGTDVRIAFGQAVLVYAKKEKILSFDPVSRPFNAFIDCTAIDLAAGFNLATLPCVPPDYTSYELLSNLGGESFVNSVQRFNPATGRFDTASYENGQPVGINFSIKAGQGLLIKMKKRREGFSP
jgi:Zn-dependent metalloprotease